MGFFQRKAALLLLATTSLAAPALAELPPTLPVATVTALDTHQVSLPRDLTQRTVVIVGFSRGSAPNTTAWEVPVRNRLASASPAEHASPAEQAAVSFYDVAVLGGLPTPLHGWIRRQLLKQVPAILQPRFLLVFDDADAWKRALGYDAASPDAAYVAVVDRGGRILSRSHDAYTPERFLALQASLHDSAH